MISNKFKILIVDDETPARNRLRDLLADIDNVLVLAEANNGIDALNLVNEYNPDIILLDIRMPTMDGIETAQHLQKLNKPPAIIFTTAFDKYAVQAFDNNAVDYLLKPIRFERLQTAINKACALLPRQIDTLMPLVSQRTHLSISERDKVILIPITDVIYLRAELKYITVRTAEKTYLIEESLLHLEQEFSNVFIRLHRNCLVANAFIVGYEKRRVETGAENSNNSTKSTDKQWVALLKGIPEFVTVSRRQQHLIRTN